MLHPIRSSARRHLLVACAVLLSACAPPHDDHFDDPSQPLPTATTPGAAQGLYEGPFTSRFYPSGGAVVTLITPADQVWAIYGSRAGSAFFADGLLQATGASSSGSFAGRGLDYNLGERGVGVSLAATYVQGASIAGTLSSARTDGSFDLSVPTGFNFSTAARIGEVAGTWTGSADGGDATTITVASSGAVTGSAEGCNFTGTLRPTNRNYFDLSLTFANEPACTEPGAAATGVAFSYAPGGLRQFFAAVVYGNRGSAFSGVR